MGLFTRQTERVLEIVKSTKLADNEKYEAVGEILDEMYMEGGWEVINEAEARGIPLDEYQRYLDKQMCMTDERLAVLLAPSGIDTEGHQPSEFEALNPVERTAKRKELIQQITKHTDEFYTKVAAAEDARN